MGDDLKTGPPVLRSRLFIIGALLTAVWLAGAGVFLAWRWEAALAMKPNEWGDMCAGVAAPIAFLWLVLGFLQQGNELQLSTHALRLQANELKNSVEQQRELVDVTRRQVLTNLDEQERRRAADRAASQPRFALRWSGSNSLGSTRARYSFELLNEGETVTNLRIASTPAPISTSGDFLTVFRRDTSSEVNVTFDDGFPQNGLIFDLTFVDINQRPGHDHFHANIEQIDVNRSEMRITRQPL